MSSSYRVRETACIPAGEGPVWSARWRPQGDLFAVCGQDKRLRLFDAKNVCIQEENKDERSHVRSLRRVAWRGDGKLLAVASFDAKVSLWRFDEQLALTATLVGHENEVKGVVFSPDGEFLASCSRDKSIFLYDVSGDFTASEVECVGVLQGHNQDVKNVVFSGDGDFLVSTSYDDSVKIWTREVDEDDWHLHATLKGHTSTVWSAAFDAASEHLVSVSADATMKIWQVKKAESTANVTKIPSWLVMPIVNAAFRSSDLGCPWRLLTTVQGVHSGAILDVAWQEDLIATASADNHLRLFAVSTSSSVELVASFTFTAEPNSVQFRPGHANELLVALDDGTVRRVSIEKL